MQLTAIKFKRADSSTNAVEHVETPPNHKA
jgi:hypothetical protein